MSSLINNMSTAAASLVGAQTPSKLAGLSRGLPIFAWVLTLGIIMLGAYTRLADAGLGCPDWPGCYGHLGVPTGNAAIDAAQLTYGQTVETTKAWIEMIHRYFATSLGALLLFFAGIALARRAFESATLPIVLVGVVILQGMFGMWTVTLKLMPIIVTGHLIGGMTILALLTWAALARNSVSRPLQSAGVRPWAVIGLVALTLQIFLGGWTSTNYAALACTDFPTCHGSLVPSNANFAEGFVLNRPLGMTRNGDFLPVEALIAIHWVHRLGALLLTALLITLHVKLMKRGQQTLGILLVGALVLQIALGIANVVYSLPLTLAVAHNGGAALLLAVLVAVNYRITPAPSPTPQSKPDMATH